jgi:hypothetical protein
MASRCVVYVEPADGDGDNLMTTMTLLETDYATLRYYPETKIMHHTFHKFIYGTQLRNVMLKGLECFQQYGLTKWLSDDRKNSVLPQADFDWSLEEWLPPMLKAGWTHWAIILPEGAVGQQAMTRLIESYAERGLIIEVFSAPEEAMQWLESV